MLKKFKNRRFFEVLVDFGYCKERTYPEFIQFICDASFVPWSMADQALIKEFLPRTPKWANAGEVPFLYRDALLLVFKKLRNFYDLFACSQVISRCVCFQSFF